MSDNLPTETGPVSDSAGKDPTYGTLSELVNMGTGLFSAIARRNLVFNREFDISGPINGQGIYPVKDMRYGIVNMARAGCGVIAVYNALLLLGNPHRFYEVAAWGDRKAAAAFGLLGTIPMKEKKLFQRLGYTVTAVRDTKLLDRHAQSADVCLFTYWNQKGSICRGMHTVCLQYRSEAIDVYNLSSLSNGVSRISSLTEWAAHGIGPVVLYCIHK